jgi:hypothetical protein
MPRSPSPRILTNTVDLYRYTGAQDADGGVAADPYGTALASGVACSVQPDRPRRDLDPSTGRLAEKTPYRVYFATDHGLRAGDKIVWVDQTGKTRTLIVAGASDQAGKGGAIAVLAEEAL